MEFTSMHYERNVENGMIDLIDDISGKVVEQDKYERIYVARLEKKGILCEEGQ